MTEPRYHSVILDEEACKGCTVCVTTCPVEAIRVRNGKARIMGERCIDCGECIRRCPHHAKQALTADFIHFMNTAPESGFDYHIALPAPSLYGQFPAEFTVPAIHNALRTLGFHAVYPVSAVTTAISAATRLFLDRTLYPDLPRPLISSSCPTIIKFIQIRFPSLLDHIVPVIAPMELAARLAKLAARKKLGPDAKIGCYFISPCAGKITETVAPISGSPSRVDAVFAMKDVHLALLKALKNAPVSTGTPASESDTPGESGTATEPVFTEEPVFAPEVAWGRAGGEALSVVPSGEYETLSVDGMDQCRAILEAVEDGTLNHVDFVELMACEEGCVGGPLAAVQPSLARHSLAAHEHQVAVNDTEERGKRESMADSCILTDTLHARPALLLDKDYRTAMRMMEEMEAIYQTLPGLDCGCCGSPNCRALAEDIVRGNARREDCVIILKEQYLRLLEDGS